jgi:RNA polymerase-interacting CarD/CdnL/TRCF family regulator
VDKERFSKVLEILEGIPINDWSMSNRKNRDAISSRESVKVCEWGLLFVNDVNQNLSFFQRRKLAKFYTNMEAELALRALQKTFDIA